MKIKIFLLFFLLVAGNVFGDDIFIRADGGDFTECDGTANVAWDQVDDDVQSACAWFHPFVAFGIGGATSQRMSGGDTVHIAKGDYRMGYTAGVWDETTAYDNCDQGFTYNCNSMDIPGGTEVAPTRILGEGYADCDDLKPSEKAELYGVEQIAGIISLGSSDWIEIKCLDITDHEECAKDYLGAEVCGTTYPAGDWALRGITAIGGGSEHILIENVDLHGIAYKPIYARWIGDWTFRKTNVVGNAFAGLDTDYNDTIDDLTGTFLFEDTRFDYNGCIESYPLSDARDAEYANRNITGELLSDTDMVVCYDSDAHGYGDAIGLGDGDVGDAWIFKNVSMSHNTSDGPDLIHGDGSANIYVYNSRFEGNVGDAFKTFMANGYTFYVENSAFINDCDFYNGHEFETPVTAPSGMAICRGGGSGIYIGILGPGWDMEINNSTFYGVGVASIMFEDVGGTSADCDGTESVILSNNIFAGAEYFANPGEMNNWIYLAGNDGNGTGECGPEGDYPVTPTVDHSIVYSYKNSPQPSGTGNVFTDPLFSDGDITDGGFHFVELYIGTDSPAYNSADETVDLTYDVDVNGFDRGVAWDMGAFEENTELPYEAFSYVEAGASIISTQGKLNFTGRVNFTTGN